MRKHPRLIKILPALLPLVLMISLLLIFAPMSSAVAVETYPGSISGKVTDAVDGNPLQGIRVSAEFLAGDFTWYEWTSTTTDSEGNYTLTNLPLATGSAPPIPPSQLYMGSGPIFGHYWIFFSDASHFHKQEYYHDANDPNGRGAVFTSLWPTQPYATVNESLAPVLDCPGLPDLHLIKDNVSWGSYADYLSRRLSVVYTITNLGASTAKTVSILASDTANTNGVTMQESWVSIGGIPGFSSSQATVHYHVPTGVDSFRTDVRAAVGDTCGNTFLYPAQ